LLLLITEAAAPPSRLPFRNFLRFIAFIIFSFFLC
jgi:hypothetical protein